MFGKETVYYCSETEKVGFDQKLNNKFKQYNLWRFKILINFEGKYIKSEKLLFDKNNGRCISYKDLIDGEKFLYCSNEWGFNFVINKKTFNFKRSFVPLNVVDDITLSYGNCEIF